MKRLLALFLVCLPIYAADMYIRQRGPYLTVARGVSWAGTGAGAFNNTYLFTPLNPDQGICVSVRNNNPTSAHTFTLNVYQTGDSSLMSYTPNIGRFLTDTVEGEISPIAAATTTCVYVHANAAARVALVFAGGGALAGTPDTADIFVVQTSHSSCGPVETGAPIIQRFTGRVNTFSTLDAIGATSNIEVRPLYPGEHTIQIAVTGPPGTCTCTLQGTLDYNYGWFDLSGAEDCTIDNMFHVVNKPVRYLRMNISAWAGVGTVIFRHLGAR